MPNLLTKTKQNIWNLYKGIKDTKLTVTEIAKKLKLSKSTVSNVINNYKKIKCFEPKSKSGAPRVTSKNQDQKIITLIENPKIITSKDINKCLQKSGINISDQTVRNRLKEGNATYSTLKTQPLLNKTHIDKRLQFAQANLERDWSNVIFADESTFCIYNYPLKAWGTDKSKKIRKIVQHPSKLHVWGCFCSHGFGKLIIFESTLNSSKMIKIYEKGLLSTSKCYFGFNNNNWILCEDNDPKHRSKLVASFKTSNNIITMDWPSCSPDLNPIENVWGLLKNKLAKKQITSIRILKRELLKEWNALTKKDALKYVNSMKNRLQMVIHNKGDHIPY
jgi:transposase